MRLISAVCVLPPALSSFGNEPLITALQGGGGPGVNGATAILLRAAVAADLNAAHDSIGYPLRRSLPSPFEPWASDPRFANGIRSEERRAGKECRSRSWPEH